MDEADNLQHLRRDASGGNAAAMASLAKRLIAVHKSPAAVAEGMTILEKAVEAKNGEAAEFMAVLCAAAVGRPQDWQAAIEYLSRAASLGRQSAMQQLAILADVSVDLEPSDKTAWDWRDLQERIDISMLLRIPTRESLSEAPRIRRFDAFLPERHCDWLMKSSRPKLERARVYDEIQKSGKESGLRTNSNARIEFLDLDLITLLLRTRIAESMHVPLFALEPPMVLHYSVGEQYEPHYDYLDPNQPAHKADLLAQGQRLATCLVYLNGDFEGGETAFPVIDQKFRCGKGGALVFANVDLQGTPDPATLHAGLPPTSGEKWLFSQWVRSGPELQS